MFKRQIKYESIKEGEREQPKGCKDNWGRAVSRRK